MQHSKSRKTVLFIVNSLLISILSFSGNDAVGQSSGSSKPLDIGILVTTTQAEAESVLKQLKSGWDFGVLAKEKSIDSTANDGGYMGVFTPDQLRPDLRAALAGRTVGQYSDVTPISSGYAILTILPAPPPEDLNLNRISEMIANGDIRQGPPISGFTEAYTVFQRFNKPDGWNHSLQQSCNLRNQSWDFAVDRLTNIIKDAETGHSRTYSAGEVIKLYAYRGQLYASAGKMNEAVGDLKAAYRIAQSSAPDQIPQLQEMLGGAYLHLSEMENDVYKKHSDFGIFPPPNPKAGYPKQDESKIALQYFTDYLKQFPNDLEVRWLLNLAYVTIGKYPDGVPKEYVIPLENLKSKEDIGRFIDVAPAAKIDIMREAGGVIVDDFDNDGLLDIMLTSMGSCDPMHFFHNNGDGTFTDRTKEAGLTDQIGALNMIQADYNNDGCLDILVLRGGWEYPQRRSLLRNNCNGTFTDVTDEAGLGEIVTGANSAKWADIDNDGYLDLFIANENLPSMLFHNKGDGTFEDISRSSGIDKTAFSKGVTAADYDHDGLMDFYVSNFDGPNYLWHNNGNLTFTDVARQAGVQAPLISFSTWFWDYDNDGWPDLLVLSYYMAMSESVKTYLGMPHNAETIKLYRNRHDGTFEDVTKEVGLDKVYEPMGSNFGDINNDGWLDMYLGMGNPSYTAMFPHVLMLNEEGKKFVDITESSGTGDIHKGHGSSFADLERRGVEDIVANFGGAIPGDAHYLRIFRNPGNNNDWINIHLVGVKSNHSAIGAEVKITVSDDGRPPRFIYRTGGENSSFGNDPLELHIGLGHNAKIDAIDVYWPTTKSHQHFAQVDKNQYIEIAEFATEIKKLTYKSFRIGGSESAAISNSQTMARTAPVSDSHSNVALSDTSSTQGMKVDFTSDPNPPRMGVNKLCVRLSGGDAALARGAEISVTLSMPAMPGMEAMSTSVRLTAKGAGVYEGEAELSMGGKWDVTITVKHEGEVLASRKLAILATGAM